MFILVLYGFRQVAMFDFVMLHFCVVQVLNRDHSFDCLDILGDPFGVLHGAKSILRTHIKDNWHLLNILYGNLGDARRIIMIFMIITIIILLEFLIPSELAIMYNLSS